MRHLPSEIGTFGVEEKAALQRLHPEMVRALAIIEGSLERSGEPIFNICSRRMRCHQEGMEELSQAQGRSVRERTSYGMAPGMPGMLSAEKA